MEQIELLLKVLLLIGLAIFFLLGIQVFIYMRKLNKIDEEKPQ